MLALYDCINCDLCIQACPNDAIFAYEVSPIEEVGFTVREAHQLAVFEGACNECSNCEVYCPEQGAPFLVKEILFPTREAFEASGLDGFCRLDDVLLARLGGREHSLELGQGREEWSADLDAADAWRVNTVWNAIYHSPTPNPVNPSPS